LLISALPKIVQEDFRVVVLGTGDPALEKSLMMASLPYGERVSVNIGFDESLARRIYAGADFFLMPSRFEPCGLGQMIAMRYGAVPVVRATGGLIDTVTDLDQKGDGNGIVFNDVLEEDLMAAVRRAKAVFKSGRLEEIVPRIMNLDNSWRRSAKLYIQLYNELAVRERN
jgi:starch synthase